MHVIENITKDSSDFKAEVCRGYSDETDTGCRAVLVISPKDTWANESTKNRYPPLTRHEKSLRVFQCPRCGTDSLISCESETWCGDENLTARPTYKEKVARREAWGNLHPEFLRNREAKIRHYRAMSSRICRENWGF